MRLREVIWILLLGLILIRGLLYYFSGGFLNELFSLVYLFAIILVGFNNKEGYWIVFWIVMAELLINLIYYPILIGPLMYSLILLECAWIGLTYIYRDKNYWR